MEPIDAASFEATVETLSADPALAAVVDTHGMPEFWHRPPGFDTLVLMILEQQVSLASAKAAFDRLAQRTGAVTPESVLASSDDELRSDGFSRQKTGYARGLAEEILSGRLDLDALTDMTDEDVRRVLVAIRGIGPWTADVYLLACLRRPDIWPVGDRALQVGVAEVLGLDRPLDAEGLGAVGERWRPHRSTAARLTWHAYLRSRGR